MGSKPETSLIAAVRLKLAKYCKLDRINVGKFILKDGRFFSTGVEPGYPDLSGRRKSDGRAVYIECKVKPNKPTPEQMAFIEDARKDHCIAGVCYSVDEALKLVTAAETVDVDNNVHKP